MPPFIVMTASAPTEVEIIIVDSLHLNDPVRVFNSLDCPNIFLSASKSKSLKVSSNNFYFLIDISVYPFFLTVGLCCPI